MKRPATERAAARRPLPFRPIFHRVVLLTAALAVGACSAPPQQTGQLAPASGASITQSINTGAISGGLAGPMTTTPSPGTSVSQGGGIRPRGGTPRAFAPPAAQADAFAIAYLDSIQRRSFVEHRELCGYFFVTGSGAIAATTPVPGDMASCSQPAPGPDVFASYHTHGAYDDGYDNEVPSPTDLIGDFRFGIDGYVSTPGGRVWRVELDERAALLICGQGCVEVDPNYRYSDDFGIRSRYTVQQLRAR